MPSELVTDYISPKLSKEDALRIIEQTLAAKPVDGRLALISIWKVDLDIAKNKTKTVHIDGSLGLPIKPPYRV
jgi:hypothetical protein